MNHTTSAGIEAVIDHADISSIERGDVDTYLGIPLEPEEMVNLERHTQRQPDTTREPEVLDQISTRANRETSSTKTIRRLSRKARIAAKGRAIASGIFSRRSVFPKVPNNLTKIARNRKPYTRSIAMAYKGHFGYLHSRLLLHKQDELRELEEELLYQDRKDDEDPDRKLGLFSREEDDLLDPPEYGRPRKEILMDIEKLLLEYGVILRQTQKFWAMDGPSTDNHASLTNYFYNHQPLTKTDSEWLEVNKDDLVSIRCETETSNLNTWVAKALGNSPRWLTRLFIDKKSSYKKLRNKTEDVVIYDGSRIKIITSTILTTLISLLLTIPIFVLWALTTYMEGSASNAACLGVIVACILILNAVLGTSREVKRHEIIAASAGYTAVLIVFISSGNNTSSMKS